MTNARHRRSAPLLTRAAVVLAGTLAVSIVSGTAYAFWTTGGTGTGTATAGSAQGVSVVVSPAATLFPGGSSSATLAFTNPNPFPVTVSRVTPTSFTVSGGLATPAAEPACAVANSGVSFATLTGSWQVPARTGTTNGTLTTAAVPSAVAMDATSVTRCQTASFTAALTVTGQSS